MRNGILKVSHYVNLMRFEGESFDQKMILRGSLERARAPEQHGHPHP